MTLYTLAGPVLSLTQNGFTSVVLGWTNISVGEYAQAAPIVAYRLYRGLGVNPQSFTLIASLGNVLTYTDNTVSSGTVYTYYVQGIYETGTTTAWSNLLTFQTLALQYVYTLRTSGGQLDIYDVSNVNSPTFVQTRNPGVSNSIPWISFSQADYMWIDGNGQIFLFQWGGSPLNPTFVGGGAWLNVGTGQAIMRRGTATRNNLFFAANGGANIKSYDISTVTTPVLKSTVSWTVAASATRAMAFDAVNNHLILWERNGSTEGGMELWDVAADGTLSQNGTTTKYFHLDNGGRDFANCFMYNGFYYIVSSYPDGLSSNLQRFRVDGSGQDNSYGSAHMSGGSATVNACSARVQGHYAYFGKNNNGLESHKSVFIVDLNNSASVTELGTVNATCNGLMLSGNYLLFTEGSTLFIYDVTTPTNPQFLGSCNNGPAVFNGITGYLGDGWGNNGLCSL
jgi:hypothetical protein